MFDQLDQSRWSGFRGVLKSRYRWWAILSYSVYAVTAAAWIGFLLLLVIDPDGWLFLAVAILALATSPLWVLAILLKQAWARANEPAGLELLSSDNRQIVLYLRPFKADRVRFQTTLYGDSMYASDITEFFQKVILRGNWKRGEEYLVEPLRSLGPVVTIGRPGEKVPPIGAIRLYPKDDWQDEFTSLLNRARIAVIFAGTSEGLLWEIGHVFKHEPFVPTLLLVPYFQGLNTVGALEKRRTKSEQFRNSFYSATGILLPDGLEYCRLVYFRERLKPEMMFDSREDSERKLNMANPFLGPIARVIEEICPGWNAPYLEQTKDLRPSGGIKNIIGQGIVLITFIFALGVCVLVFLMIFAPQLLIPLFE